MSEMTVRDFARLDRDDQTSLSSFEGDSLVRSLSQPSLARSGSEFTEHWGVPARNLPHWGLDDDEVCSSTDTTPRPIRREVVAATSSSFDQQQQLSRQAGPSAAASSSFARSARYSEREMHVQQSSSGQRPSSWFHDDSEPEMQI